MCAAPLRTSTSRSYEYGGLWALVTGARCVVLCCVWIFALLCAGCRATKWSLVLAAQGACLRCHTSLANLHSSRHLSSCSALHFQELSADNWFSANVLCIPKCFQPLQFSQLKLSRPAAESHSRKMAGLNSSRDSGRRLRLTRSTQPAPVARHPKIINQSKLRLP
jgi:hypothetical protein